MKKFLKTTIFLLLSAVTIFAKEEPLKNKVIEGEKSQLKVMTYNIAAGANNFKVDLKKTAETIKKINPDIIGIQEVDKLTGRSGKIDQGKILAELTGYNIVYGKAIDHDGGEYGIAVLTKHQIKESHQISLPSIDEQRIALITTIDVPNFPAPITYINTHLDWHENPTERMNQIYAIDEHQLDIRGIKILGGDFNDTKESNVIKQLGRYWESVIPENMDNRTWPAVNPEVGIDNIFTNKAQKWNVKTYIPNSDNSPVVDQIEWNKVSDHLPVISILELVEQ